jgi:hypothetical protein
MWYELTTWCIRTNCTLESLQNSFATNLFALTAALNEIAQIAVGLYKNNGTINYEDTDEAYYTW